MQERQSRSRRVHSAAFKAQVVAESEVTGASVAQVALRHGVNANLVHRWRRAAEHAPASISAAPAFLPLVIATAPPPLPSSPPSSAVSEIRIELRRGAATVSVRWPASAASECGAWLSAWLR